MKTLIKVWLLLGIAGIVTLQMIDEFVPEPVKEEVKQPEVNNTRGFNFETGRGYIPYESDQQVRDLRSNNTEYIFKVPGRQIKSEQDIFEERMEEYIEDHHEEILEEYKDR